MGAVFDGAGCARCFRGRRYHVHVPKQRRVCDGADVDGYRAVVQCSGRIARVGSSARGDRGDSRLVRERCGTLAARRDRRWFPFILQSLLVLVTTLVLNIADGYQVVALAVDHLRMAVSQDLSSRYCPDDKTVFLTRGLALFAFFVAVALALFFANHRKKGGSVPLPLSIMACALLAFAIGSAALVLYGLSGCSGAAAEGLLWDSP